MYRALYFVSGVFCVWALGVIFLTPKGDKTPKLAQERRLEDPALFEAQSPSISAVQKEAVVTAKPIERTELSPEDQHKAQVLDEVLTSRNDNDPRLDNELRTLSPQARAYFRQRYAELPSEKRNEKGTIVFLLGRNLETPEDFAFMNQVVAEAPCLSLSSCGSESADGAGTNEAEMGANVTLAYPQLVAIQYLEKALAQSPRESSSYQDALRAVEAARESKSQTVADKAEGVLKRYKN